MGLAVVGVACLLMLFKDALQDTCAAFYACRGEGLVTCVWVFSSKYLNLDVASIHLLTEADYVRCIRERVCIYSSLGNKTISLSLFCLRCPFITLYLIQWLETLDPDCNSELRQRLKGSLVDWQICTKTYLYSSSLLGQRRIYSGTLGFLDALERLCWLLVAQTMVFRNFLGY